MKKQIITKSAAETQKLGISFALRLCSGQVKNKNRKGALVIGLIGSLGSGKTTFLQGFAQGLCIKEKITSPTFVILKHFKIKKLRNQKPNFTDFYHIDCYRIQNSKELLNLGFKEIISNSKNIVAVEWSERIKKTLPKNSIKLNFKFIDEKTRTIDICY